MLEERLPLFITKREIASLYERMEIFYDYILQYYNGSFVNGI